MFKIIPRKVWVCLTAVSLFLSLVTVSPAQASLLSSYLDKLKSSISNFRRPPALKSSGPTITINYRILNWKTGEPIKGAQVDIIMLTYPTYASTSVTDMNGRARLLIVEYPGGTSRLLNKLYSFKASAPGYAPTVFNFPLKSNYFGTIGLVPLDKTPPEGEIKINKDAQYTRSRIVNISLTAKDQKEGFVNQIKLSNDNVKWFSPRRISSSSIDLRWILPSGDGEKTIYAKFRDNFGNWSSPVSDTIILDTTRPKIIINSPRDKAYVNQATVLLQGTVDGEAFSEERALAQEGENTLTKSVTDAGGNTSSVSLMVYYYIGKLIGKEGGEISSPDGKLKLIIPPDALTEPQPISISSVDIDSLKNTSIPKGTALLAIAECLPKGLVFQKEVDVIYLLDQAEIPGTPIELGLFDRVQNTIIPVGHTTTVPSDGYTITCHINHFSTYAALKGFISQGAPIGAGVKIPLPDMFTGSFSHAIPLTVPPGRKGIQPSLGLSYRSGNGNSWVGVGYSLNPGYITRSTKLGPPSYDDKKDTFYFISDSGTTELVYLTENLYQSKIESSFTKFFKESDDSWRALSKDGSTMLFGKTAESKEGSSQPEGDGAASDSRSHKGTFSWYLTKAQDTNGNYLKLSYTQDQGKSYLSKIDYTGNENTGFNPTNSVEFILEDREDIASSYITTSKIATAKRLKEVQAKVGSDLVWRYKFEYTYSPDTNRSLLTKAVQYGADDKNLPVQTFKYQKAKSE